MAASIWAPGSSISANSSIKTQAFVATAGQTVFPLTGFTYVPGTGSLQVYVSGLAQRAVADYSETDTASFTLTTGVPAGTIVYAVGQTAITGTVVAGVFPTLAVSGAGSIGSLVLGAPLPVASGGTGSTTGTAARAALGVTFPDIFDAAGDLTYGAGADVAAKLAIGALGTRLHSTGVLPEWQGTWFKAGTFSRVMSVGSGNVAYTGIGFKPKAIIFLGNVQNGGTQTSSVGFSDGSVNICLVNEAIAANNVAFATTTSAIYLFDDAGSANSNGAVIASFDADGFTLTWTKAGTPTNTANCGYLAFR